MTRKRRYLDDNPPEGATSFERALYNAVDPTGDYPDNKLKAIPYFIRAKAKQLIGDRNIKDYIVGNSIGEKVADAAWAKRLNMPYDENLLPVWNGDTVRLPYEIEQEIPTDTTFIKDRIQANKELQKRFPKKYANNDYINAAIKEDENTLKALRKTYSTGKPVGISEMSWNTRQLLKDGEINDNQTSPLNVLKAYNIRYDKDNDRIYYSDEYDFNQYENFIPGKSFRIRGYVDLNKNKKKSLGGSINRFSLKHGGIYIKPSHRGRFNALKERTGHSASWFKENGTPAQKKMATFALNAAKWNH